MALKNAKQSALIKRDEILKKTPIDRNNKITIIIFYCFIITAILCYAYFNSNYSVVIVDGQSMYPTANIQEREDYTKKDHAVIKFNAKYSKGDIIIAATESGSNVQNYVIKRVIALEGDTLTFITQGSKIKVVVNGEVLDEDYINPDSRMEDAMYGFLNLKYDQKFSNYFEGDVFTIPENYVYYMGDNRDFSYDCNNYGPVEEKYIVAKVIYIVPYGQDVFIYSVKTKLKEIF